MKPAEVAWRNRAACRPKHGHVEEIRELHRIFFDSAPHWTEAKKMCAGCPSKGGCLDMALAHDAGTDWEVEKLQGFFGGMNQAERAAELQRRRSGY